MCLPDYPWFAGGVTYHPPGLRERTPSLLSPPESVNVWPEILSIFKLVEVVNFGSTRPYLGTFFLSVGTHRKRNSFDIHQILGALSTWFSCAANAPRPRRRGDRVRVGRAISLEVPWQAGDKVRWRERAGVYRRDVEDGEHAEIVLAERVWRVRRVE